jgi:hypothetical protein
VLDHQQIISRLGDQFSGLNEKLFKKFVHDGVPQSNEIWVSNTSGRMGLTR